MRPRKPKRVDSSPATSESLEQLVERLVHRMQVKNFSSGTIHMRRSYLQRFLRWCDDRGITRLEEITREVLLSYQRYLYHYRNPKTDRPLKFSSQASLLVPIRAWFRFLLREKIIAANPASDLEFPKEEQRLPGKVLSAEQAELILNQPDVSSALGLRDRAMLETFYSTAMRRSELIHLDVYDLDAERGIVMIRHGKGAKDRNVPIGNRALSWVTKYVTDVRPALVERTQTNRLFVSCNGHPFGASNLSILVRDYLKSAGITQGGSCHLFRHSAATQMLENGAGLRQIQAMLGHSEVTTTQIYTHLSIKHLKEVHGKTHPADLPRKEQAEGDSQDKSTEDKSAEDDLA